MDSLSSQLDMIAFYGRDALLSEITKKMAAGKCRLILRGVSGVGKSEFQRNLQSYLGNKSPEFICLLQEIKASTTTVADVLAGLTVQLLQQVDLFDGRLQSIRNALNRLQREHTVALGTAALLDLVGVLAPNLKNTTENLTKTLQASFAGASPKAMAEQLAKAEKDDMLLAFFRIIESLDAAGHRGCILFDRLESGSASVQDFADSLATYIPPSWSLILTVNDETPEGIQALTRIQPRIKYLGGEVYRLPPLDIQALQAWTESVRNNLPSVEEMHQVLKNCDGRPLYLKDWVAGLVSQSGTELIVNNRVGEYYQQRVNALGEKAQWLLTRLAIFPQGSSFHFDFCHKLLSTLNTVDNVENTWAVVLELVKDNFIERDPTMKDGYRLVHEVIRIHLSQNLPKIVLQSAASTVLKVYLSENSAEEDSSSVFTKLTLARLAGQREEVELRALPVAAQLLSEGAYTPALDAYRFLLEVVDPSDMGARLQADLGIAKILLHTGYYQEALERLESLAKEPHSESILFQIALQRGKTLLRLNRYCESKAELEKAERGYDGLGEVMGQVEAQLSLNTLLRDLEMYSDAAAQAQTLVSRVEAPDANFPLLIKASCYRVAARSFALFGRWQMAAEFGKKALSIAREEHSIRAEGNAHFAIGEAYRHGLQITDAYNHYQSAFAIANKIGNRDSLLWSVLGLADAFLLDGQQKEAWQVLKGIEAIVGQGADRYPIEYLHWRFGMATIGYLNGDIVDTDLLLVAGVYDKLHTKWPSIYAEGIIAAGAARFAKPM